MKALRFDVALIVVLMGILTWSYLSTHRNSSENDIRLRMQSPGIGDAVIAARLHSFDTSVRFIGTDFPQIEVSKGPDDRSSPLEMRGISVVIVLSDTGCNPCYLRELRNMSSLFNDLQDGEVMFLSLYLNLRRTESIYAEGLMVRKVAAIKFPMWYTSDKALAQYISHGKYPMLFVLRDQTVVSSFLPVSTDDEFSSQYFETMKRLLNESR